MHVAFTQVKMCYLQHDKSFNKMVLIQSYKNEHFTCHIGSWSVMTSLHDKIVLHS